MSAILVLAITTCYSDQTIYRYLAVEGPEIPETVSNPASSVSLPPVTTQSRGESEGPFADFRYALFNGAQYYEPEPFSGESSLADGFTVTAYVRLSSLDKDQIVASSMVPGEMSGFRLEVDYRGQVKGQLFGRPEGGIFRQQTVVAERVLIPGIWYRITYRYGRSQEGGGFFHDLWINDEQVGLENLGNSFDHTPAESPPVFGAERGVDGPTGHLQARVLAMEVDDYARSDLFLTAPVIRDGSLYFGQIAFHDYLGIEPANGKAAGLPLERRIYKTVYTNSGSPRHEDLHQRLENLMFIPFLNDGYVPQGFAVDQENRRIFLAYYHRTQDNVQYSYPSIIAEVFLPDCRLGNVFLLHEESGEPMTSHIGGIAYWNGFLFAPGHGDSANLDPDLFVYDISEIPASSFNPATLEGFAPIKLNAAIRLRDPLSVLGPEGRFNSLSFMGVHYGADGQPYFHTGNFQQDPRPTHIFKLGIEYGEDFRYPVLSDPVTLIQSHRRAQGMSFYVDVESSGRQIRRALLSNSWGDADSTLYTSLYLGNPEPAIGLPYLSLPAGMEDLGRSGKHLLTWFESGALYYQKRDSNPWQQLFPFIAKINITDLIDITGNGIPDEWYVYHRLAPGVDPSTDTDKDGFSILEEFLWDTDPGESGSTPWVRQSAQPLMFELPTSGARFYTFEQTHDFAEWNPVPGTRRVRGNGAVMTFQHDDPEAGMFYRIRVEVE